MPPSCSGPASISSVRSTPFSRSTHSTVSSVRLLTALNLKRFFRFWACSFMVAPSLLQTMRLWACYQRKGTRGRDRRDFDHGWVQSADGGGGILQLYFSPGGTRGYFKNFFPPKIYFLF